MTTIEKLQSNMNISIHLCVMHPLAISPYSTAERQRYLAEAITKNASLPKPIVRQKNGEFEVISGWDVIAMLRQHEKTQVDVLYANYTDDEALGITITDQYHNLGLHWTCMARAIVKAKSMLKMTDQELSKALNVERTYVTKYRSLAEKLSPNIFRLAEQDRISVTGCRLLQKLTVSKQEDLARYMMEKHVNEKQLLIKAGIEKPSQEKTRIDTDKVGNISVVYANKSQDTKRAELHISERIGFPVSINQNMDNQNGQIEYLFFSFDDLVSILKKIKSANGNIDKFKGAIRIEYASNDDLNDLIAGFFQEDGY